MSSQQLKRLVVSRPDPPGWENRETRKVKTNGLHQPNQAASLIAAVKLFTDSGASDPQGSPPAHE